MPEREAMIKLVDEYRPRMSGEILHSWAKEVQAAFKQVLAQVKQELEPIYHLRQFGDVTKEELDRYMRTGDINPTPLGETEKKPEKRCMLVENCKSCKYSLGRLTCTLAHRDFDSITRSAAPPDWCPLPVYTAQSTNAAAENQEA